MKGTTGTQASFLTLFGGDHQRVRELDRMVTTRMGFTASIPVSGQTYSRKIDAQVLAVVSGIAATASKFSGDIRLLQAFGSAEAVLEAGSAGLTGIVNHDVIPSVVYTWPEIAGVGLTEEQAKERGEVKTGKFPMLANSRAKTNHEPEGFVKVIADAKTDRILGVHIIGANASELIGEAVVTMEFAGASEDLARICHAHPTLSEVVHEAALAVDKRPLHF